MTQEGDPNAQPSGTLLGTQEPGTPAPAAPAAPAAGGEGAQGGEQGGTLLDTPQPAPQTGADQFKDLAFGADSPIAEEHRSDILADVRSFANANGLNMQQAQAVLKSREDDAVNQAEVWDQTVEGWGQQLQQTYGDTLPIADRNATAAVLKWGPPGMFERLQSSGFIKHPDLFAVLSAAGATLNERQTAPKGPPAPATPTTEAELWNHAWPNSGPLPSLARQQQAAM